jgi:hypothetical protein
MSDKKGDQMSGPIYNKLKRFTIASIVTVLVLQSTLLSAIISPKHALAASASITNLVFTTHDQMIKVGEFSQVITIETRNESNLPEAVSEDTNIILTTESSTGLFYNDFSGGLPTTSITIPTGSWSASFYYKETSTPSAPQIQAELEDNTNIKVSQMITVSSDTVDPINASITNITDGVDYGPNTIPSAFSGTANDNVDGIGLGTNSTVLLLKRTKDATDTFWNGSEWIVNKDLAWLPTTHLATDGDTETTWTSNVTLPTWEENATYSVKVKAIDKVGNYFEGTNFGFYYDNTAPTFSSNPIINSGEDTTNNLVINLTVNGSDANYVKIWGDITTPDSDFEPTYSDSKNLTLTNGNGWKKIHVLLKDIAGNISVEKTVSIFYSTDISTNPADSVTRDIATGGIDNTTDIFSDSGSVEISASTLSETTQLFAAKYSKNPISGTTGIKFLNHFYDFSVANDSLLDKSNIQIYIFFTQNDLDLAGISKDNLGQMGGLYFYDFNTNKWTRYSDTGIVFTTEKTGYIGYVRAKITHFTPMAIGLPSGVSNLTASSTETEATLNWDKIDDATGYWVKYRKANTSDDYKTVFVDSTSNSVKISDLSENIEYEFGVAAKYTSENIDSGNNVSVYTFIKKTTLEKAKTITKTKLIKRAYAADSSQTDTSTNTNSDSQIKTENHDNDTVAPDEESSEDSNGINWTKLLVTLGIIVLAAGAGFGGYYGYQWWVEGSQEEEKKEEKKTNKKKNKRDNRW